MRRRRLGNILVGHTPKLCSGRIPMAALIQMLAVVEHLSFHRAALALGTSQSSVSARIKALESNLGIVLFDRNTRDARLTEARRRFVDQVHDAIEILDHAIKTPGMQARGEEGEPLSSQKKQPLGHKLSLAVRSRFCAIDSVR